MFVRTLYGLAALAVAAGLSSAQQLNSPIGSRPAEAMPSTPIAYSGTIVKLPSPTTVEPTNREARLLAVNPEAPSGFNGPVYNSGDEGVPGVHRGDSGGGAALLVLHGRRLIKVRAGPWDPRGG